MNHPTIMFRKEILISRGGYDDVNRMEDYYLWIKLISSGFVFENLKTTCYYEYKRKFFFKKNRI